MYNITFNGYKRNTLFSYREKFIVFLALEFQYVIVTKPGIIWFANLNIRNESSLKKVLFSYKCFWIGCRKYLISMRSSPFFVYKSKYVFKQNVTLWKTYQLCHQLTKSLNVKHVLKVSNSLSLRKCRTEQNQLQGVKNTTFICIL